jgi:hypothetical protein
MPDLYKFAEKTTTEDMLNYSMPCTAVIISLYIKVFSPSCQKAKFRKKIIFIQTNSFIIYTCLNLVLLVLEFGLVGLHEDSYNLSSFLFTIMQQ